MSTYTAEAQERTKPYADQHNEPWTLADVELLLEFTDNETDEELARCLGRTLHAVVAKQHELRNGRVATGTRVRQGGRVELAIDRGVYDVEALFA